MKLNNKKILLKLMFLPLTLVPIISIIASCNSNKTKKQTQQPIPKQPLEPSQPKLTPKPPKNEITKDDRSLKELQSTIEQSQKFLDEIKTNQDYEEIAKSLSQQINKAKLINEKTSKSIILETNQNLLKALNEAKTNILIFDQNKSFDQLQTNITLTSKLVFLNDSLHLIEFKKEITAYLDETKKVNKLSNVSQNDLEKNISKINELINKFTKIANKIALALNSIFDTKDQKSIIFKFKDSILKNNFINKAFEKFPDNKFSEFAKQFDEWTINFSKWSNWDKTKQSFAEYLDFLILKWKDLQTKTLTFINFFEDACLKYYKWKAIDPLVKTFKNLVSEKQREEFTLRSQQIIPYFPKEIKSAIFYDIVNFFDEQNKDPKSFKNMMNKIVSATHKLWYDVSIAFQQQP
ncbi:hypothetical protein [Ureaplasma urealyticum]|uniref:Lipoprotein, putative n=1 Tax=Ureaplasma urealyticum serovar 8 str. ATCC 27618 TaxID=626095 RepID=A0ABM9XK47_UREUR|nr:hypothetical protein [Ureaplasma urealyticum]EEH01509.1 lipoprotein, putative [Ureaplasma urealyticum serovar 8 str. ATCC 27618]